MNDNEYQAYVERLIRTISSDLQGIPKADAALIVLEASLAIVTVLGVPDAAILRVIDQILRGRATPSLAELQQQKRRESELRAASKPTLNTSLGDLLAAKNKQGST